ncbi:alpha/beta hydrolase [Actinoplanes sp. NPDC049596]|uniref:alpha/beta fold hydrolase n=1 Tax=unclassified Actinoplanes TaxID=2626549 RepID=UPI003442C4A6
METTIDGVRQAYHVAGQGPVCLVLPGGPGCHWSYMRSPELEQHFTLVYVEPVGTGESGRLPSPSSYGIGAYVRFAAALIERLELGPVLVLGHSYGGCVAQQLTLDHPELVAGLILYDAPPVLDDDFFATAKAGAESIARRHPDQPDIVAAAAAFGTGLGHDDASATAYLRAITPLYFADWGERRARYEQRVEREWILYHEPSSELDSVTFDSRARLGEITAPALIVAGQDDFIAGPRWAQVLHEGISGSTLVVLPDTGHFPHIEDPAGFVDAVVGAFAKP